MEAIKYYNRLSETLGKETAEDIINLVELQSETEVKRRIENLMTKEDGEALRAGAVSFQSETKTDFEKIRTEMAILKADLIKWMFIFWTGQIAVTVGVILAVFK